MCMEELYRCIGQTVTIFITGGGVSGCGFTGVLVFVSPQYVTLVNRAGLSPSNPCDSMYGRRENCNNDDCVYRIGSICDIPVNMIASFCHNAI